MDAITELKKTLGSDFKFSKVKKEPNIPKNTIMKNDPNNNS
jgi:hypothetical protein